MRNRILAAVLPLLAVTQAGCIRTVDLGTVEVAQDIRQQSTVRTASNLPPVFAVVIPARVQGDCPPRLRDDGVGATLDLHRSMSLQVQDGDGQRWESFGDYRVTPPGHYGGTTAADGLRINCRELNAVGLVTLGVPVGG